MLAQLGNIMDVPTSLKILVVEDDAGDVLLLKEALKHAYSDFEFWHVRTVMEAYALLQNRRPDVVILDLSLPDGVGVEVVHKMHACAMQIPIVVLTGRDDEAMALICLNAGAQDFLSKSSLKSLALRRAITFALSRQREYKTQDYAPDLTAYQRILSDLALPSTSPDDALFATLKINDPDKYAEFLAQFSSLFAQYLNHLILQKAKPRAEMAAFIASLLSAGAAAADLIDLQIATLRADASPDDDAYSGKYLTLFGLELMTIFADTVRRIASSK